MVKLYLDMANVSSVPEAYRHGSGAIMNFSGINLGNFAFRHALQYIVGDFKDYLPVNYTQYLDLAVPGAVDRVLVSCANWLGATDDDEKNNAFRTMVVEKTNANVDCFGLGVQAKSGTKVAQLRPNTIRMAKVLAERATNLSVRDETTQNTLEAVGITNTVITGCPSNFINGDRDLGRRIAGRAREMLDRARTWKDVRSLISEASGGHAASNNVIRSHLRLMEISPAFYAVQTPALLPFLFRENDSIPSAYASNSPFDGNAERLRTVLKAKLLHFSSIEAWMDFSRTCDLSYGMRIHGTMIPLQSGVPSLLIAHDSRTVGLARFMGIPALTPEEFMVTQREGPRGIFSHIEESMAGYDAHRAGVARVMYDYVTANGLRPHPSLAGLVA